MNDDQIIEELVGYAKADRRFRAELETFIRAEEDLYGPTVSPNFMQSMVSRAQGAGRIAELASQRVGASPAAMMEVLNDRADEIERQLQRASSAEAGSIRSRLFRRKS